MLLLRKPSLRVEDKGIEFLTSKYRLKPMASAMVVLESSGLSGARAAQPHR